MEISRSKNSKSRPAIRSTRGPKEAKTAIKGLIESYRNAFLNLDPAQLAAIWDNGHDPLIYVAQEKEEPIRGWAGIQQYFSDLPVHIEEMLAKRIENIQIDVFEDIAIAFFISRSIVKIKGRTSIYEPSARVTMIFRRSRAGWQAIHYHESAPSAQSAKVKEEISI